MNSKNKNESLEGYFLLFGSTLVYKTSSLYQNIYVTERSEFQGMRGKFRLLQFSSNDVQGIINLDQKQYLVVSYIRVLVDLINHFVSAFKNGFIIGHGIGTISSHYSDRNILTAEIDPIVVEVSKQYFGHTGKNVVVGDGQALLKTQDSHSEDFIILDAFSGTETPYHLTTKEFFTLTNDKLSENGILIMNYIGKVRNDERLETLYTTISGIFPDVKLFATNPKKSSKQNIFIVASRSELGDYSPQEAAPFQIMVK
ncbi:fused MFS/spermidine synthase [Neobacillus pocheonensis]|uniref:spermidine synthase n=1 Tax=Neobacillus pocheonensis TaxID=363869 RepID=UPI003D275875